MGRGRAKSQAVAAASDAAAWRDSILSGPVFVASRGATGKQAADQFAASVERSGVEWHWCEVNSVNWFSMVDGVKRYRLGDGGGGCWGVFEWKRREAAAVSG